MAVIDFLYVSLGSSTVQLYDSLGRPASVYWNKAPIWGLDQILITVKEYRVC
jgi:hypothetical protein